MRRLDFDCAEINFSDEGGISRGLHGPWSLADHSYASVTAFAVCSEAGGGIGLTEKVVGSAALDE